MAVNYSPEDIGFFIIDYKGGGMANLFDNLPHMIGSISNLSGNQVKRAMVSIQSENRRRQRIFTEYGVNNINGYTKLYKSGDATEPVPHLFIIIDEFAELKREEPEFMKELISVAQVGRSLGVHMILSTQRPSGTVDENIWANSKFRLCLRVQDRQDSMDMLHRVEAAYLTQAGRCYLQVGNDEIFDLFQSGYSGASYDRELGGGSLLIAQMLSVTGKVDLAGNRSKLKRKEAMKRRWIGQLLDILAGVEEKTGLSVLVPDFTFENQEAFKEAFYRDLTAVQPDFEETAFNNARIQDFIDLCKATDKITNRTARIIAIEGMISSSDKRIPEARTHSQLEVTADYLRDMARKQNIGKIRKLWLPVLPEHLYLDAMSVFSPFNGRKWPEKPSRFQLNAIVGMADDPANQAQFPVSLDFVRGGNHMLIGTVSTGKSTFLQTTIYSLTAMYPPSLLNIYCLDFSAKMLSVFKDLKHVGGYLDEEDVETDAISKFFTMIGKILDERKAKFAGTSFEDAMNHDGWTIPAILIVIDNYGSFHQKTGEDYDAVMSRIVKEGNGYGVFLIVSAGAVGMNDLPNQLADNFRTGIALEMPDPFAYSDVLHVVKPEILPESRVKGRGLMFCGDRLLEFQTALAAPDAEGHMGTELPPGDKRPPMETPVRNDRIRKLVEKMNGTWDGPRARAVPRIPDKPVRADFISLTEYEEALGTPSLMPAGYDFEYANVYSLDLVKDFAFLITGSRGSGKSVLMENLMLNAEQRGDQVYVVEIGSDTFAGISEKRSFTRYTDGAGLYELMAFLNQEIGERAAIKRSCIGNKSTDEELFKAAQANSRIDVFIGNALAVIEEFYNPDSAAIDGRDVFEALCERGKGYNIYLYVEAADKDLGELSGYTCFESLAAYQSGIRFGGRFGNQQLFQFANVPYQDQDRSLKTGIGVIPSDNEAARLVKVVVPMS